MADKIPVKAIFTGPAVTALGEFIAGDTVPIANGGTGADTAAGAVTALGASPVGHTHVGLVSGLTDGYIPNATSATGLEISPIYTDGTNVGIGTSSITGGFVLDVAGAVKATAIRLTTGKNNGYVLTSDADGDGSWQSPTSGMTYKGAWNATTNSPALADGTGTLGDTWAVAVGGTQFGRTFVAGGWAIYNGSIWEPIGTSAAVTSVNSKTGAVVLDLASSDFANQGTTSTVLHGNASGSPAFGAVALASDVSGTLPVANGGTGLTTISAGRILYGNTTSPIGSDAGLTWEPSVGQLTLITDTDAPDEGILITCNSAGKRAGVFLDSQGVGGHAAIKLGANGDAISINAAEWLVSVNKTLEGLEFIDTNVIGPTGTRIHVASDGTVNVAVALTVGAVAVSLDGHTHTGVYQPEDAELTAIAGLASAADRVPYFTGSGTAALATLTTYGRSLIDDVDAATARATLGLGTANSPTFAGLTVSNLTSGYMPKAGTAGVLGDSPVFVNGTSVGIGTATPSTKLEVVGTVTATAFAGPLTGNVTGTATNVTGTVLVSHGGTGKTTLTGLLRGVGIADINDNAVVALGSEVTGTLTVDHGGTGLTSLSTGFVPFGSSASAFSSSSKLFWDDINKRLGIGTLSPAAPLSVVDDTAECLRLMGSTSGGVGLRPAAVTADQTYTLPAAYPGAADLVLSSTTGGVMSWTSKTGSGSGGIVTLNGQTGGTQTFSAANGITVTSGADNHLISLTIPVPVTSGGTGLTSLTAGHVPFGSSSTALSSSSELFWDDSNKRLGIGTNAPATELHLYKNTGITLSRGDPATYGSAKVACVNPTGALTATGLALFTTSSTQQERVRITPTGMVGINTTAPVSVLAVKDNASTCLQLMGSTSGYVGFRPAATAGSVTYTLPSVDGTAGQVLLTSGGATLSWGAMSGANLTAGTVTYDKLAAMTSADLASKITNETGTGLVVFNNGPTLIVPNLGFATATKLDVNTTGTTAVLAVKDDASTCLRLLGSTSGYVGFRPAATAGAVTYTLPSAAPAVDGYVLTSTTTGTLSWGVGGGGGGGGITSLNGLLGASQPAQLITGAGGITVTSAVATHQIALDNPVTVAHGGTGVTTFGSPAGVVHANAANPLTSSLIVAADITNGTITYDKLATTTTSANFATRITDETGTVAGVGLMVFNNGPTLISPALGAATATSLDIGTTGATAPLVVKDNAANCLRLQGSTSGYIGFRPPAVAGAQTYTLPSADGDNGYVFSTNGSGVTSWAPRYGTNILTPEQYGGVADGGYSDRASMTASSTTLTLGLGSPYTFTAADIGKKIIVEGAGAGTYITTGVLLTTTISDVPDAWTAILANAATVTAVSGYAYWGTDNSTAFTALGNATARQTRVQFSAGIYFSTTALTLNSNTVECTVSGAGKQATIILIGSRTENGIKWMNVGDGQTIQDLSIWGMGCRMTAGAAVTWESGYCPQWKGGLLNVGINNFYDGIYISTIPTAQGMYEVQNLTIHGSVRYGVYTTIPFLMHGGQIWSNPTLLTTRLSVGAGGTTVTGTSGTFTSHDIGSYITIAGAGTGGTYAYKGRITAVASATSCTITPAATTAVTNATGEVGAMSSVGWLQVDKGGYLADVDIIGGDKGLVLAPDTGASCFAFICHNVLCDAQGNVGFEILPTDLAATGSTGAAWDVRMSGCWFATSGADAAQYFPGNLNRAVNIDGTTGGYIESVSFVNCQIINARDASLVADYVYGLTLADNCIGSSCATSAAQAVLTNCENVVITGNRFSQNPWGGTATYCLSGHGITGAVAITGNVFRNYSSAPTYSDDTSITHNGTTIVNANNAYAPA